MSELTVFHRGQPILREILTDSLTVGSGLNCDMKLIDSVAANHAKIEVTDKAVHVIPLEGPVLLNSERINSSQKLGDADVIDVGRYRIQYFESSAIFPRDSRDRTLTASFHEANPEKAILPHLYFLSPFKKRFRQYALSLGRSDDCDISVNDPYVSTRHAEIEFLNGHYYIRDLNSRNGTFLNDYRISNTKMPSKGTIRLGRFIMVYEIEVVSPTAEEKIPGIAIPGPRPGAAERMIVFNSALFSQLMKLMKKIAPTEETTLLLGETGVGKDVLAVYLHSNHPSRKNHPYIAVNCAEISPTMADSQFFGHVSGAFTGAVRDHQGFFEQANKGTLFLDEIGELPTDLQAKLLRVMEDGLVRPLGSTKQVPVAVRLIAATNRDLDAGKLAGSFRADLYERFDRMLSIPPLRERKEDIVPIASYFIRSLCSSPLTLSLEAAMVLERLPWPGNIRALRRTIRTAITNATYRGSSTIDRQDLEIAGDPEPVVSLRPTKVREKKREAVMALLETHKGNMFAVAQVLHVTRKTLYRWCREDGIDPEEYRDKGEFPK